jgi:hypothetical protein
MFTMKGDFSRIRFNPQRHYTSVLEQQGRVSLDADANEQRLIDEHTRRTENDDIIGVYGAPRHDAGFAITLGNQGLQAGPGRYYVNGLLCENESLVNYDNQPYLLNPPDQVLLLREMLAGKFTAVQVFLEVWQRLVTALDDACLREPALGQADTTARVQTVWRVVAEGVVTQKPQPAPSGLAANLNSPAGVSKCCAGMYSSIANRTNLGKLAAQTSGQTSDCNCQPTPTAGYRGLENQLYRVEIHTGGDETTATFKWSRENGAVVAAVTNVSGSDVIVDSLGPDANLGFQAGQWVEISDDTFLFGVPPNQPGDLYQIANTTPEQLTLTMNQTVAAVDTSQNARLRRWEQFGPSASSAGVPLSAGTWLDLENGIQVQFAAGPYQPGDYWLIPARTASGQIEWPPCGGDGSEFQPPKFTPVYRAPLACIHASDANRKGLTIDDCRLFFLPLTELAAAQAPAALHVSAINWSNDDFQTLDQLLANGLKVSLDAAFTGRIDASTFVVSIETASTQYDFERLAGAPDPATIRSPYVIDGTVSVSGSDLLWQLPRQGSYVWYAVDQLLLAGAASGRFARARVTLAGRDIFNGAAAGQVFLDGESFGTSGFRSDGKTPRIDLQLPSGNAQKASDFKSWFYLGPVLQISSFTIVPAAVKIVRSGRGFIVVDVNDTGVPPTPVTPTGTITLNYPALTDTVVELSLVSSGSPGVLSFPSSVTVPAGQLSAQFQIVVSNPGATTISFQLTASINLAGGLTSSNSTTLGVTGTQIIFFPPAPPVFVGGNLNNLNAANKELATKAAAKPKSDARATPAKSAAKTPAVKSPPNKPAKKKKPKG